MQVYTVKSVPFSSGERLPMLMDSRTGKPVFETLTYALHYLRGPGQAVNTIEQFCRVMALLHTWLDANDIRLQSRLEAGQLLADEEIHDLVRLYKLKAPVFEAQCDLRQVEAKVARVTSLERYRKGPAKVSAKDSVAPETAAIRLFYTRKFLVAQAEKVALKVTTAPEVRATLIELKTLFETRLKALAPASRTPSDAPPPEGLSEAQMAQVLAVVDPQSADNPWKSDFVRKRNQLIVQTLHALGVRGGELLKLKTSDLKPANASVRITRSPDDPVDTRLRQPQAKTRARELGLSPALVGLLLTFVTTERKRRPRAKKHPFLFTTEDGDPLSLSSLYKLFATLRKKCPFIEQSLTAHVLRYTATDEFLAQLDASDMEPSQKEHELRYIMGWSDQSMMPMRYGKRHIAKKANEVLVARQKKHFKGHSDV